MRLLHVYSGNLFGGIESILVSMARNRDLYPQLRHEFALCFDGRLSAELSACAAVHMLGDVRASRPHSIAAARRRLASVLAAAPYDAAIFHAPWSFALFATVARRAGVPSAIWVHDVWTGRHWTERLARRQSPALVIVNSEFTASTLGSAFGAVHRAVIRPLVDVTTPATSTDIAAIRRDARTSPSSVVIVQASRLEAWKGHASLLRALATLDTATEWVCWIAGGAQRPAEQRYQHDLRALASELRIADRVRFLGERSDMGHVLAAADIYCQPNLRPEPFGVVLVEALAAGRPVVTVRAGGAVEIVDDSCGRLVAPDDVDALRQALRTLIDDEALRAQLGAAGPARAARISDPSRQLQMLHAALAPIAFRAVAS
ncbi:MAG TPA: glycosyltransferase [Vicinamibacterales bacterium]|nr:glycosyltransferase [Vicinamibacterales bacterium]